jgi:hypothetical protein
MNFKTTLILIALLAVVGGIFWYSQSTTAPPAPPAAPSNGLDTAGEKMLTIKAADVNKIIITPASGPQTQLEKTAGKWNLVAPIKAGTVDFAVSGLLADLTDIRTHGRPQSDPGSDSGLAKPAYTIQLTTDDGKNTKYAIGAKTPLNDMAYAQVDGSSDINLVDASVLDKTLKNVVDTVRDKHLITLQAADIRQVKITYKDQNLAMQRELGKWVVTSPERIPGDDSAISSLVDSILATQATSFFPANDLELPFARFDHPTMTVWLSTANPTTQPSASAADTGFTLTFGAPEGFKKDQYFVKTSDGLDAKVPSSTIDALKKTPLDLRDKDVLTLKPDDVKEISITKEIYAPPTTQPAPISAATQAAAAIFKGASASQPATMTADASTQPAAAQPASIAFITVPGKLLTTRAIDLVRRPTKGSPILGPAFPGMMTPASQPATMASAGSSTMASTMPSTMASATTLPVIPTDEFSVWEFKGDSKSQVDDGKVSTLLSKFQPLHADQFLAKPSSDATIEHYIVDLTTTGPDGADVVQHIEFFKPAAPANPAPADPSAPPPGATPTALFNNLNFEVQSAVTDALNDDFKPGKAPPVQP